jgi:peroxiredoxin
MSRMLQKGQPAPAIDLLDLDGRRRRPLEERAGGSRSLLVIVKDDCPTCRYTLPFLERLHAALGGAGSGIFAISQDERTRSRAFAAATGVTFPMLLDTPDYAVSRAFGIEIVPSIFVIDPRGAIERSMFGFRKAAIVETAADLAASKGIVPPPVFREGEEVLEIKPG